MQPKQESLDISFSPSLVKTFTIINPVIYSVKFSGFIWISLFLINVICDNFRYLGTELANQSDWAQNVRNLQNYFNEGLEYHHTKFFDA